MHKLVFASSIRAVWRLNSVQTSWWLFSCCKLWRFLEKLELLWLFVRLSQALFWSFLIYRELNASSDEEICIDLLFTELKLGRRHLFVPKRWRGFRWHYRTTFCQLVLIYTSLLLWWLLLCVRYKAVAIRGVHFFGQLSLNLSEHTLLFLLFNSGYRRVFHGGRELADGLSDLALFDRLRIQLVIGRRVVLHLAKGR